MAEHTRHFGAEKSDGIARQARVPPRKSGQEKSGQEIVEWRGPGALAPRTQGELGEIGLIHSDPAQNDEHSSAHCRKSDLGICGEPVG